MGEIGWLIVSAEIAFWIVIALGLIIRYVLKRKRLGLFFLALTQVIDLVLLIATTFDLYNGATATNVHAIAAIYLGVSIAFGKNMIAWADQKFTYYILKQGNKPRKKYGFEHARHEMKGSLRHLLAFFIGGAFIVGIHVFIGIPDRTVLMLDTLRIWAIIVVIDLVISASHFLWPKSVKE